MKAWAITVCAECKSVVKLPHSHKLITLRWTKSKAQKTFELIWDFDADSKLIDVLDQIGQRFFSLGVRKTKLLIEEALRNSFIP
jgi:hypothetical protein